MAELKAVIFDMDGVIIDSEPIHSRLNMELYRKLGFELTVEEYSKFVGVSIKDQWYILKEKYDIKESIEELIEMQNTGLIDEISVLEIEPIPGIRELLAELKKENIKTALASSSTLSYINAVLEKFALTDCFPLIISGENLERSKPHPAIFLKTAEKLNLTSEECVVIEDSRNGVTAALEAGMKCIAFSNPNSGKQDISKADIIVNSIEEINIELLKKLISA
ncbi:MAG: HAD family phosphatase [Halanaerobiaceae bacterium]|jgi:HAD superfamily hydrolase (TIGR01509 family)|nr:HAD family phosphatase [Halanaerobiaceae bacterium]